ncbi:MAG TPA: oligosaccharide flippase family protein [Gemmatimonadaceae bacterium]|nr:oligosaccharide flippase family protein [Gemmatimonadaceae bacterium]
MGQLTDLGADTFRSGVAALSVRIAQAVLSLIATFILARLLTPEDFGVVAMVVPFVILTNGMGNQGFQTALIQAHDLPQVRASAFFAFAARANLGLTAGFVAMSVVLAWFYDEPRVMALGAAWALLLWLLTLTSFQEAMLKRDMRFPVVLAIQLAALAVGVACGIAAARLGAGYWAFFVQALVVEVVRAPAVHLTSGWWPSGAVAGAAASLRSFWRALAGFRAAAWASEQPDRLLVGRLGGAPTLGLYDTAQRWSWYPFAEPFIALSDIAVVSLSRVRGDAAQYRLFFARQARAILTIGLPAIAFIVVEPASVVRVLLGAQWDAAVPYVRLLGIAAFFGAFTRLSQWVYFSSGTTDRLLRWWLRVQTPVLILAALAGVPFGPWGVAVGYAAATVALAIPSLAWSVSGTPLRLGTVLHAESRPAIAAIVAALLLVTAARLLPAEAGAERLAASAGAYAAAFVFGWLVVPGGPRAAHELFAALRELKPRSPR